MLLFWKLINYICALLYRAGGAKVAFRAHNPETWFESNVRNQRSFVCWTFILTKRRYLKQTRRSLVEMARMQSRTRDYKPMVIVVLYTDLLFQLPPTLTISSRPSSWLGQYWIWGMWHAAKDHSNLNEGEGKEICHLSGIGLTHPPFTRKIRGSIPLGGTKGVWQNSPTLTKLSSSQRPLGRLNRKLVRCRASYLKRR